MKTNYTSKTMNKHNKKNTCKAQPSRFDRFLNGSSSYMADYAVVKGGLSPFQNGFFVA